MSKISRWLAPAALVCAVAAGAAMPAQAASQSYTVTATATSPNYPGASHSKVDGYALVVYRTKPSIYHWNKNWSAATVSGSVSGATAGDVATLFAEQFGAKSFTSTGHAVTLASTGTDKYSFTVTPSLETHYEVKVTTGSTLDATSNVQTVYVSLAVDPTSVKTKCSGGHCKITGLFKDLVPPSAYNTESAKHWYFYFDLDTSLPKFPKYLSRDRSASASKARKVNSGEFEVNITVPFSSHLANAARYTIFTWCTKDDVTKDGIGLPGSHGCGASKVLTAAPYLG